MSLRQVGGLGVEVLMLSSCGSEALMLSYCGLGCCCFALLLLPWRGC